MTTSHATEQDSDPNGNTRVDFMNSSPNEQNCDDKQPDNKISSTINAIKSHNIANAGLDWIQHLAACKMLFLVTVLYFLTHVPIYIADHFFVSSDVLMTLCNYLAYLSTWTNVFIYYNTDSFFKNAANAMYKTAAMPHTVKLDNTRRATSMSTAL